MPDPKHLRTNTTQRFVKKVRDEEGGTEVQAYHYDHKYIILELF